MSVNTKSMALWFLYLTNGSAVLFLERTQGDQTGLRNLRYRARWFVVVASFASQLWRWFWKMRGEIFIGGCLASKKPS